MKPSRQAAELRADAQKCQWLASNTFDAFEREALINLASEFERQAELLGEGEGTTALGSVPP